jgi:hypothetical protein
MKKHFFFLLIISIFTACNQKKSPLAGVWKMQEVTINGSSVSFDDIGQPFIEFNNKGGYMINMGGTKHGVREKGTYELNDKELTLTSEIKEKLPQKLMIEKISEEEVKYYSKTDDNKMEVLLIRDLVKENQLSRLTK